MTSIPVCSASDPVSTMTSLLADAGALVITDAMSEAQRSAVSAQLAGHLAAAPVTGDSPDDFYPGDTRRITGLIARSPAVRELAADTTIDALCRHHLGDNCEHHQLHVTAALEVGPGARSQILHREEDAFDFFPLPRPNLILASMWAITDFTADNGGTLIAPGSHRWDAGRTATPEEVVPAEMPAGSVLIWLGGTLHGAGANVTEDDWRHGVILTYSLGWLRQEENQYLDIPAETLSELPRDFKQLTGHAMHGALGLYDPSIR